MHSDHVEHRGVVKEVTFSSIIVRVDEPCHCEGCAIAVVCGNKPAEDEDLISVPRPRGRQFEVGDRVRLEATSGSQLKAAFWSFVMPTLIILAVVIYSVTCHPELGFWAVIIAIGAVAIYDLLLFLFRKDLAMSVHWQIRHC